MYDDLTQLNYYLARKNSSILNHVKFRLKTVNLYLISKPPDEMLLIRNLKRRLNLAKVNTRYVCEDKNFWDSLNVDEDVIGDVCY